MDQYNDYLLDAPPNPLTFNEFKNAVEGIQKGTLPNNSTSMLPSGNFIVDASTGNEELLKKLLNPKLKVDEFIDKEDEKEKRQKELLEEIMKA